MKLPSPRCTDCGQREEGFFCSLARPQLEKLDRLKTLQHYRRGQVVYYEGQPPPALYCIYSGRVKLYKVGSRDEEQVIRLLGPADITGYRPILAGELCAATAEAVEPTTLCVFPPRAVFSLIHDSTDFALRLLARLARELRVSEEQMLIRTQEPVRQRIARVLLWLHAMRGPTRGIQAGPPVRVRRIEMAQMAATTPETLSRTLRDLAGRGVIRLTRTDLAVNRPKALRDLAAGVSPET